MLIERATSVRAVCLVIGALLVSTAGLGAEIYRSVDADGNVSYSDRPVDQNSETIFVATQTPTQPPSTTTPGAQAPEAAPGDAAEETTIREPREPTPEERAEDRARNCGIARERLERYMTSMRLYRTTPDGERQYLSDAEIDEARARAASDVEEWCD